MKKSAAWLIASLLAGITVIFLYEPRWITEPVFEMPEPKKDVTIVALGDSLTKGEGDFKRGGYVGYVQNHLEQKERIDDVKVYNYAVIGDTSDGLLKKLKSEDVLNRVRNADLILFTIGGNDLMSVVEKHFLGMTREMFENKRAHYKSNLEQTFTILREHNAKAKIIYVGMYNPFSAYFPKATIDDEIIKIWSNTAKQTTSQYKNAEYVQIYDLFKGMSKKLIYKDNFHPNHAGYDLIGERVMQHITLGET
ncbi:MAG TPA: SGNH/GDSL hydrolase family protein [Bacillales bacterium]|nr:SGNH/GDSL hydrolase family protein [Bacillales bacterium]